MILLHYGVPTLSLGKFFIISHNSRSRNRSEFKQTKIVTYSRAVVIHSGQDDLGLGGTPLSNTTGNSGSRVACGVIGTCK